LLREGKIKRQEVITITKKNRESSARFLKLSRREIDGKDLLIE